MESVNKLEKVIILPFFFHLQNIFRRYEVFCISFIEYTLFTRLPETSSIIDYSIVFSPHSLKLNSAGLFVLTLIKCACSLSHLSDKFH